MLNKKKRYPIPVIKRMTVLKEFSAGGARKRRGLYNQ